MKRYIYKISHNMYITPIQLDCSNLRTERQTLNNKLVANAIKSKNKKEIHKNINNEELKRVVQDTGKTLDELINECSTNDILLILLSRLLSKNASRQGCKDEHVQLQACNTTTKKYGITIENLSSM